MAGAKGSVVVSELSFVDFLLYFLVAVVILYVLPQYLKRRLMMQRERLRFEYDAKRKELEEDQKVQAERKEQ